MAKSFHLYLLLSLVLLVTSCATTGIHLGEEMNPGEVVEENYNGYTVKLQGIHQGLLSTSRFETSQIIPQELLGLEGSAYKIGKFDIVQVTVYEHPELTLPLGQYEATGGQVVGFDGKMFYPYLGRIQVEGKTTSELREFLTEKLGELLKAPQIDVKVGAYRSQHIQVAGEVQSPGLIAIQDKPIHLAEAIQLVGGFGPNADLSKVELARENKVFTIDVLAALQSNQDLAQVVLKDGDRLRIPNREENQVYMLGEVSKPSAIAMHHGRLSLTQALSDVGGLETSSANSSSIYVIRYGQESEKQIEVFHLNAENPLALAVGDHFALEPRDLVFVDANGLARWNRFIKLILPTFQLVNSPLSTAANGAVLYNVRKK